MSAFNVTLLWIAAIAFVLSFIRGAYFEDSQ
jgi:hypothetical protein